MKVILIDGGDGRLSPGCYVPRARYGGCKAAGRLGGGARKPPGVPAGGGFSV